MQSDDSRRLDALSTAFNHLLQNQDRLEQRLARLESLLAVQPGEVVSVQEQSAKPPILTETLPAATPEEPLPAPPEIAQTPPAPAATPLQVGLESKVGLTLVNRIGAVTLVLGVAFFFKWAVDNNWIGPAGRVMLGLLAGFVTLGAADYLWRKRQQVFAQGITATGVAIIYLALYAAFDFYHLIPQAAAFVAMVATTAMAAVLALRYKSFAIAALGLAAAYATPLLLSTGEDHPWFLFSYLLLLNFAATELSKRGGWPRLEFISFVATTLIYGTWLMNRGEQPEKRLVATLAPLAFTAQRWRTQTPLLLAFSQLLSAGAVAYLWLPDEPNSLALALLLAVAGLAFAHFRSYPVAVVTAFLGFWFTYAAHLFQVHNPLTQFLGIAVGFLVFLAWSWWQLLVRRTSTSTLVLSIFALNGVVFYAHAYDLLQSDHHGWLGPLSAMVAAVYLAFGILLHRLGDEETAGNRPALLALGIAASFLTLAIPIQFTGFTITIAWAIQAAALTWIGCRLNSQRAVLAALVIFALVAGRLCLFEAETLPDADSYSLLWNSRFLTFAISAAAMLLSSFWSSKTLAPAALATYFAGTIALLSGLCLEVLGWAARAASPANRLSVETTAVSILFAVYAVALVSIGVAARSAVNRLSGLVLIGIVVLKLYFFDVWQLSRPFQILAFVILGILLLCASFLYSHFRRLIETWWKDDKAPV